MNIGQIVDYCITYNEINKNDDDDKPVEKLATQRDIDNFF